MFELEFMEAVKSIAREMRKSSAERADKNPNWEQRRYEIATQLQQTGTGIKSLSDVRALARAAVDGADVLVEELRAPYNKRDYGTGK